MRTRGVVGSSLVLVALCGPSAHATADGPDFYAVVGVAAGNVLNLRAEPSVTSRKVGAIPSDERGLRNLGCRGGPTFGHWEAMSLAERRRAARRRWCRVRYGDTEGWVAGWFLREDAGPQ